MTDIRVDARCRETYSPRNMSGHRSSLRVRDSANTGGTGLLPGDDIQSVNGHPLQEMSYPQWRQEWQSGAVSLTVIRRGIETTLPMTSSDRSRVEETLPRLQEWQCDGPQGDLLPVSILHESDTSVRVRVGTNPWQQITGSSSQRFVLGVFAGVFGNQLGVRTENIPVPPEPPPPPDPNRVSGGLAGTLSRHDPLLLGALTAGLRVHVDFGEVPFRLGAEIQGGLITTLIVLPFAAGVAAEADVNIRILNVFALGGFVQFGAAIQFLGGSASGTARMFGGEISLFDFRRGGSFLRLRIGHVTTSFYMPNWIGGAGGDAFINGYLTLGYRGSFLEN